MSAEDLKRMVLETTAAFNRGELERRFNCYHPDYIHHNADLPQVRTCADYKQHMIWLAASFPGIQACVEDMVVEGTPQSGMISARISYRARPQGGFPILPAGQPVEFQGVDMLRVVDGKVVEGWEANNIVFVLQKLGCLAHA